MAKSRHFKFRVLSDTEKCMQGRLPQMECVQGYMTSSNFKKWVVMSRKRWKIETGLQRKT